MTFVNQFLLFGLAAAAIPLLIHLLHRSRPRVIPWGAMQLLRASVQSESRRFRIEQLLLVLIRTMTVVCLVLMLSRPVVNHLAGIDAFTSGNVARAVVLDVSYSMGRTGSWSVAMERCRELLSQLSGDDTLHIVLATGQPLVVGDGPYSANSIIEAQELLDALEPAYASADLVTAIHEADERLRDVSATQREIVVVSDFQQNSWPDDTQILFDESRNSVDLPHIFLVPVGMRNADASNWSVIDVHLDVEVAIAGDPVDLRVSVRRGGPHDGSEVRVWLTVDELETFQRTIVPTGGAEAEARFRYVFDRPGDYRITAHVDGDELPGDDRFYRTVTVGDVLPVLILDGDPRPGGLQNASGFLELALAPFRDDGGGRGNVLEPTVVGADEAALSDLSLQGFAVVFLVNVPSVTQPVVDRLERFVQNGGGLVIFGGPALKPSFYNFRLHRKGQGILPATIVAGVSGAITGEAVGIVIEDPDDRAVRSLAAFGEDLGDVTVRTWHRVRLKSAPSPRNRPRVLASLTSGDPFLIGKDHGDGRVVLCTTSCGDSWSNLPTRTWFVPFLHDLVLSLVPAPDASMNLSCGDAIVHKTSDGKVGGHVVVRAPDGDESDEPIRMLGGPSIEYRNTCLPGFYVVFADGRESTYAVNVDREESDLEQISRSELLTFAEHDNVELVSPDTDLDRRFRERQYGKEIWKPLLALILCLLLLEMFVQQRMQGVGRQ